MSSQSTPNNSQDCEDIFRDKNGTCRIPLSKREEDHRQEPTHIHELSWRIFRIMSEFVDGFQILSETSKEVTFWGGTRIKKSSKWYKQTEKLARMLSDDGFTIITGGGPGIMEAANKGAAKAGGESIGFNIELPFEQHLNEFVNKGHSFHYFFSRKVMMAASAQAYVFCPGGFGTMDEFFEIITLIQTKKMQKTPVICLGSEYWGGLLDWVKKTQLKEFKTISKEDLDLIQVVDDIEEAHEIISQSSERTFF